MSRHDFPAVEALLKDGVSPDVRNHEGATPLMFAARDGQVDIMRLLLSRGADVNAMTRQQATPLMAACQAGHRAAVELLLGRGAKVDHNATHGATPLAVAAAGGHAEIVKILLAKGADPNAKLPEGLTATVYAAQAGHPEVVRTLAGAGADLDAKTDTGRTALMHAVLQDQLSTVKTLLELGADLRLTANQGEDALHLARGRGNPEVVALLEAATVRLTAANPNECDRPLGVRRLTADYMPDEASPLFDLQAESGLFIRVTVKIIPNPGARALTDVTPGMVFCNFGARIIDVADSDTERLVHLRKMNGAEVFFLFARTPEDGLATIGTPRGVNRAKAYRLSSRPDGGYTLYYPDDESKAQEHFRTVDRTEDSGRLWGFTTAGETYSLADLGFELVERNNRIAELNNRELRHVFEYTKGRLTTIRRYRRASEGRQDQLMDEYTVRFP